MRFKKNSSPDSFTYSWSLCWKSDGVHFDNTPFESVCEILIAQLISEIVLQVQKYFKIKFKYLSVKIHFKAYLSVKMRHSKIKIKKYLKYCHAISVVLAISGLSYWSKLLDLLGRYLHWTCCSDRVWTWPYLKNVTASNVTITNDKRHSVC